MPNNGWWWPRAVTSTGKELFTSNACSLSKCSEVFKTWEDGYDYILKEMYAVQIKNGEEIRLDFEKKYAVKGDEDESNSDDN